MLSRRKESEEKDGNNNTLYEPDADHAVNPICFSNAPLRGPTAALSATLQHARAARGPHAAPVHTRHRLVAELARR